MYQMRTNGTVKGTLAMARKFARNDDMPYYVYSTGFRFLIASVLPEKNTTYLKECHGRLEPFFMFRVYPNGNVIGCNVQLKKGKA